MDKKYCDRCNEELDGYVSINIKTTKMPSRKVFKQSGGMGIILFNMGLTEKSLDFCEECYNYYLNQLEIKEK